MEDGERSVVGVNQREWGTGSGGIQVPWACAVPANPKTSEAPKITTATVSATAFRMGRASVVIGSFRSGRVRRYRQLSG